MSRVIKKVSGAFPKLSTNIRKTSRMMQRFERDNRRITKAMKKTGRSMKQIGVNATIGLTAPIAAIGAMAIRTGIGFEKGMNKVQSITQASTEEMAVMRKEAINLGSTTAFKASEAADAMAFLGQAGFKTTEIMSAIGPTLDLAAASGTDLARTADIMSNVMGGFGIEADKSTKVADVLAKTTASANVDMEMIAETMKDAAPVARQFGSSLEETASLAGKLGDAGIQGSKAGTTLKQMFLSLASPSEKTKKLLGALGVKALDPVTGKMRKMTDILVDLGKGFEAKGVKGAKKLAVLNEIFGKRAIAGAGVLLESVRKLDPVTGKYINTVDILEKKLSGVNVTAKQMAEQRLKGLGGAFTKLSSAFEGFQLRLLEVDIGGKKLGDRVVEIVDSITKFFNETLKNNAALEKWLVIIAGIVAVLGPVIAALGFFLTILPSMVTGVMMAVTAFKFLLGGFALLMKLGPIIMLVLKGIGIAIGFLLSPIGLVVAAVAGLINLFFRWEKISKAFKEKGVIEGAKTFFGFGSDEVPKGKGITGSPQGEATKAKQALDTSRESKASDSKARLAIEFSGERQGTKVLAEDKDGIIDTMTGSMGAL